MFYASRTHIDASLLARITDKKREMLIHRKLMSESVPARQQAKREHNSALAPKPGKPYPESGVKPSTKAQNPLSVVSQRVDAEEDDDDEWDGNEMTKRIPNVVLIPLIVIILVALAVVFENEVRRGVAIIAGVFSQQQQGPPVSQSNQSQGSDDASNRSNYRNQLQNGAPPPMSTSVTGEQTDDNDAHHADEPTNAAPPGIEYDPDNLPGPTDMDGDGNIDPPPTDLDGDGWMDPPPRAEDETRDMINTSA
jgi:hypothetical protein